MIKVCLSVLLLCSLSRSFCQERISGVLKKEESAFDGYTLFAPLNVTTTYLIDNCGRIVNTWESEFFPGNTFYLANNGNLVRTKRMDNAVITGGGGGGGIEIFNWQGDLIWSYEYNSELARQHHDIALMPNGNILVLAWSLKTEEEALAAGRNPDLLEDDVLWSEEILEIKPVFSNGGHEVVWRWELWDHVIQDFDASKENYGIVQDHPELVDLNYVMSQGIDDWIHANSLDYNSALDQIAISSPFLNEFWIIDHSTTTDEAASHAGGSRGKGGDILYRWGNPKTYRRGEASDQLLFGQHHVHWIKDGLPHEGKIMLFNNNAGTDYSAVWVIQPPVDNEGNYQVTENAFGPAAPSAVFATTPLQNLFSRIMSGAEMLSNGNVLVMSSLQGKMLELTEEGEVVWEYKSPVTVNGIVGRDYEPENPNFASDPIFRAIRLAPDHPALQGKSLTPSEPIEGEPWFECGVVTGIPGAESGVKVFPNPVSQRLYINNASLPVSRVMLSTPLGQPVVYAEGTGGVELDVSALPDGFYFLTVGNRTFKIVKSDVR